MVERFVDIEEVRSSILLPRTKVEGRKERVCSSVVERCPDKTEVEGSIPSTRTRWQIANGENEYLTSGRGP